MPGEVYEHGSRLKCRVVAVGRGPRGASVTVSRTHPDLVRGLFAQEVPEVADGSVEIVALAREAGHRTQDRRALHRAGLGAKGACIGPVGSRVRAVTAELHGEKIDIVDWSADPARFVASALSPARVTSVEVVDPVLRSARVVVPDYQLSLAIGKEGQNARLAARLTGWRIDIRSDAAPAPRPPVASPRGRRRGGREPRAGGGAAPRRSPPRTRRRARLVDGPSPGPGAHLCGLPGTAPRATLLRVVAVGGDLVPDPAARLPGRGASVHPDLRCVALADKRRAFPRALRLAGPLDVAPVREHVQRRQAARRPRTDRPAATTATQARPPHGQPDEAGTALSSTR